MQDKTTKSDLKKAARQRAALKRTILILMWDTNNLGQRMIFDRELDGRS